MGVFGYVCFISMANCYRVEMKGSAPWLGSFSLTA
jgi:hypothetical protein